MGKRQAQHPTREARGETPENQRFWTSDAVGVQRVIFYKRATLPQ